MIDSMRFPFGRRLLASMTAALFVLSAVAHSAVAAGMSAEGGMVMSAAASEAASHESAPCPMSSGCVNDATMRALACFAHCATVVGILSEPIQVLVPVNAHVLTSPALRRLASLHGPPEPHPPKRLS